MPVRWDWATRKSGVHARYFERMGIELVEVDLQRHRLRLRRTRRLCRVLPKDSLHEVYFEFLDDGSLFTAAILKN
ncbi:hypothetical protein [Massilia sp. Root335]|jgi:hypothetical protein|uniref:hypothetical protein n=1 Tax=Massilia sp. Root335 TaxID=1736517 RepID=UPI0006FC561F|nr:hypothetical protein [Massilia sp. Root335]KQV46364.1 hypothetical protein ASC93_14630 [Massilia sp. Root335]